MGKKFVVTGGLGFIGSNFIRWLLEREPGCEIVNLDRETYAGRGRNLADLEGRASYRHQLGDVADGEAVKRALGVDTAALIHFAAETHVDRSLLASGDFIRTNVTGTFTLLEAARRAGVERFLHVSTDEVYGSTTVPVDERQALNPSSPYSASKAAADLLALSYAHSFSLPVVVVRMSNNYGPFQHPEKLIPLFLINAMANRPLPLYGDGLNERDWLFVADACRGVGAALERGRPGEIYNLATGRRTNNLEITGRILAQLGRPPSLIRAVEDRAGHDRCYAIDPGKAERELGWRAETSLEAGLEQTAAWYRSQPEWWQRLWDEDFAAYYQRQYAQRLADTDGRLEP